MKNLPKKIYLQTGDFGGNKDWWAREDFDELGEVLWCQDQIEKTDPEYVLKAEIIRRIKDVAKENWFPEQHIAEGNENYAEAYMAQCKQLAAEEIINILEDEL